MAAVTLWGVRPSGTAVRPAEQAQSNEDLARRFVEACRDTRTILPATTTIERLCADAHALINDYERFETLGGGGGDVSRGGEVVNE